MQSAALRLFRAAFLAVAGGMASLAAAQNLPAPEIAPARHFRFTPEPGTAWYLDGSTDGQAWHEVAGPFFATGAAVDHLLPAGADTQFKLRFVNPAAIGHAPVVVDGHSVRMERSGEPVEVVFMNAVRGFIRIEGGHMRSFTYSWLKKSPNEGEAVLSGLDGTFTLLRLKFSDGQLGRWGMEDIASLQDAARIKETLDAGAFTFREGRFSRGTKHASLPKTLAGSGMALNEGGLISHLHFATESAVTLTAPDGNTAGGTYAYDPESATHGELDLDLTDGQSLGLGLDLTAPGVGRYKEIIIPGAPSGGIPRNGTFTRPEEQEPGPNDDCPPDDLAGLSFIINDSSPCTLSFNGDGRGMQTKEVDGALEVTHFTYSYSQTGGTSGSVAITFPGAGGDLVDDYQLEFRNDCSGNFDRDSSSNGASTGSESGTFGPGGLAGLLLGGNPPGLGL